MDLLAWFISFFLGNKNNNAIDSLSPSIHQPHNNTMYPLNNQLYNLSYYNSLQPIIQVYFCVNQPWDLPIQGLQECGALMCNFTSSKDINYLTKMSSQHNQVANTLSVGVYQTQGCIKNAVRTCKPYVDLTLSSTMEAYSNFGDGENDFISHKDYDGSISVHPWATIQRAYFEMDPTTFVPLRNYSSLVKSAVFVSTTCHVGDNTNGNRQQTIIKLRELGLRIDGLGGCLHSIGPGGVAIKNKDQFRAANHYMFYIAHEHSYEPGYVSEKGFNGFRAGSVPIYFGDSIRYRAFLPHPRAAIVASDFSGLQALVDHIHYLMHNETAYEEHRAWRKEYSYDAYIAHMSKNPLLAKSWHCRVCEWALHTYHQGPHKFKRHRERCLH